MQMGRRFKSALSMDSRANGHLLPGPLAFSAMTVLTAISLKSRLSVTDVDRPAAIVAITRDRTKAGDITSKEADALAKAANKRMRAIRKELRNADPQKVRELIGG